MKFKLFFTISALFLVGILAFSFFNSRKEANSNLTGNLTGNLANLTATNTPQSVSESPSHPSDKPSPTPVVMANTSGSPLPQMGFTDNNTGESVIIKTDKGSYTGASGAEVYFSAQNIGKNAENFAVQFYFPKNLRAGVAKIEQKIASFDDARWEGVGVVKTGVARPTGFVKSKPIPSEFGVTNRFSTSLSSGETKHFRAEITFEEGSKGEFWIEAIGDKGGYGLLDPTFTSILFSTKTAEIK